MPTIEKVRPTSSLKGENNPRVWIIAPTLNEAGNIVSLLEAIQRQLFEVPHSICIVDDGSRDGTVDLIRQFAKRSPQSDIRVIQRKKTHHGSQRGSALWISTIKGVEKSGSDVFVEMDADLSHRPEELKIGIELIRSGACNFAIASKYLTGSQVVNRPWGRRMVSRVANFAVRFLISRKIRDYSNGYRFYDRRCAEIIAGHRILFGSPIYLSEVVALLLSRGTRFEEFPTLYIGRDEGVSKLRLIDLLKAAIAVFEIAVYYHCGRFGQSWSDNSEQVSTTVQDSAKAGLQVNEKI